MLRGDARLFLFDFLDRDRPEMPAAPGRSRPLADPWGRGKYYGEIIRKPSPFAAIRRRYKRFGIARDIFRAYLAGKGPFDVVLIQTMMTYWYPGVAEVIEDVRRHCAGAKIVLGGVYATLCPDHAARLGADLVVEGADLDPFQRLLGIELRPDGIPFWEGYENPKIGILKLGDGCPFRCGYCSVSKSCPEFKARPPEQSLRDLGFLYQRGVCTIAFYDDALFFHHETILAPFLEEVLKKGWEIDFHTPNALHAQFITKDLSRLCVRAGFRTFFLGFESGAAEFQRRTGAKVSADELSRAVGELAAAGADPRNITAYLLLGHPETALQELEASMHFAHGLGIRIMLAEFSPIPGTPDGEACRRWTDLDEPLNHNKTAFPILLLGEGEVNRLKNLCKKLNRELGA
jgi:radical SAM superfamily enzyme YgiQ (UPF0313 family)